MTRRHLLLLATTAASAGLATFAYRYVRAFQAVAPALGNIDAPDTAQSIYTPKSKDPDTVAAYAVARAIPYILSKLKCYCGCNANDLKHRSLLDCFKTRHGASCPVCRDEAMNAKRLYDAGKKLTDIQKYMENVYGF